MWVQLGKRCCSLKRLNGRWFVDGTDTRRFIRAHAGASSQFLRVLTEREWGARSGPGVSAHGAYRDEDGFIPSLGHSRPVCQTGEAL